MTGDNILNYVFDYFMCKSINEFTNAISLSTADVFMVMSRKAACFITFLKRHGKVSFDGKLVTDRVLDFDTKWLEGKRVILIDDVIVSGTTIYSVIEKLKVAKVCNIKVYVLGVNQKFFNKDIFEYIDSNQQAKNYLESPYIPLSDAACMRVCSNIVSTFALDLIPYDVDFPKHDFLSISVRTYNHLISCSDWYSHDVSSDLQAENDVKNVTMLPSNRIKKQFDQEVGLPISKLGFFKIRLFARQNRKDKKGQKYTVNAVPYFLFNAITAEDVQSIFDAWFPGLPNKPESNIAKMRILQFVIAEKLYRIWTTTLNSFAGKEITPLLDKSGLLLIFPEDFYSVIINAIDSSLNYEQPLKILQQEHDLQFKDEIFKSKIVPQENQKDNMAVLQTKLIEPFTNLYFTKEKESREIVLNYGKKAFEMPEFQSIIGRLKHGYSYRTLIHLLDEYPDIYDKETTVSLFIDEAIDAGVIVPIIAEESNSAGEVFYFRAYRHGEDVPFGELQEKLCAILLSNYAKKGGEQILTKLRIEKMLVLFIHIGLKQRIFKPSPQDNIYYNVNVDAYLQGNVATTQDGTSTRSYHYLKHRSDAVWLSDVLVDKGIILTDHGKVIGIEDGIDIDIDRDTKAKVSAIGETFAILHKRWETKTAPFINDKDMVNFSTCMFPQNILNALGAELAIFEDRWTTTKRRIQNLITINPNQVIQEIVTNDMYEAINSGQDKFFRFMKKEAQKRIEEISQQLEESEISIYGHLWNQFWTDNSDWNFNSIDRRLLNIILSEGKFLVVFNMLCRILLLCCTDVSDTKKQKIYMEQIVDYQGKLQCEYFIQTHEIKQIINYSQKILSNHRLSSTYDPQQSIQVWKWISHYTEYIPPLLADVSLSIDRHGRPCDFIRYIHAIHLVIPEELFSMVGTFFENAFKSQETKYQSFPISEPTVRFPERGLWIFLNQGYIKDINSLLFLFFSRFPAIKGARVFYKLSESLRLKMVEGTETKNQFGKFSSYVYTLSKENFSGTKLPKGKVLWVIEDSKGNAEEIKILNSNQDKNFYLTDKSSIAFRTTVSDKSLVYHYIQKPNIDKYRKDYSAMENKCKIFISYSDDSPEHITKVKTIADRLRKENFEVYFYEDEPFGTDMIKFMRNLDTCDIALIIGTPEYKEKAYDHNDSGVSFEDRLIAGNYMSEHRHKIIPIAFGEFRDCIPAPFDKIKGMSIPTLTPELLDKLVSGLLNRYVVNSKKA